MTQTPPPNPHTPHPPRNPHTMTPASAMRRGWAIWLILVAVAAAATGSAFTLASTGVRTDPTPRATALAIPMAAFGILIPLSFLAHWYCFRHYWKNGVVQPRGYLIGCTILWSGITLSILISSLVSILHGTLMPDIMIVLTGTLILLLTWPSGWAMVTKRPFSEEDDEEALHIE